jgi:hypothetical protein
LDFDVVEAATKSESPLFFIPSACSSLSCHCFSRIRQLFAAYLPTQIFLANLKDSLAVDTQKSNPTTQGAATPRLSRGTVIAVAVSYLSLHRGIAVQSDVTIQPAWEQELDASNALTTLSQKPPVEENESECSISTSSRGNPATIPCQASRKKMQTEWCQGCNLEWI